MRRLRSSWRTKLLGREDGDWKWLRRKKEEKKKKKNAASFLCCEGEREWKETLEGCR